MDRTAKQEITLTSGDMQEVAEDLKKSLENMGFEKPWCVGFQLYFEDEHGQTAKMGGFAEGFTPKEEEDNGIE